MTVCATPTISTITSSTANGTYKTGDVIQVKVTFSEDVNVTGSPTLTLNTTGTATFLTNVAKDLDFNYTVSAGQNVANLKASTLSGTIISASDGNSADLTISSNLADGIIIDTNAPVCSITSPTTTDLNTSSVTLDFNCSGASSTLAKIDSNVIAASGTSLSTYLTVNTIHTITLDANDAVGNMMTQMSMDVIYDTNAPTAGAISADSTWTNEDTPKFNISATHHSGTTGLKMAFSCTNASGDTNWTSWINYATSYSSFDINNSTYGCLTTDWNKTIYIKFKDAAGNIDSARYLATQLYDNVAPSTPSGLSVTAGNAKATLSWTAPSADNNSGNKGYKIYKRQGTSSFTSTPYETITSPTTLTKEYTNLTNGTQYCYEISTYDLAGNESSQTTESCITPQTTTSNISVKKNDTTADYTKNGDVLSVVCTYSESASGAKMYWAYYTPNSSSQVLKESSSSVTSLSENLTVNTGATKYDKVGFRCEATGSAGSGTTYVLLDNNSPIISWFDTNNTFIGVKRIIAKASDDKYLSTVELDFNNVKYGTTKDANNNYYADINTIPFENGNYQLKATATDKAGNKTEITRTVTLENIQTPKQKAEKMISTAKDKQKTANDLISYFRRESVAVPQDLNIKKQNADNLLKTAETDLAATKPETALDEATQAVALYEEFNKNAKIDTNQSKTYTYDSNSLIEKLKQLGFNEQQAKEVKERTNSMGIERRLIIVKVGDGNNSQAKIQITFTNDMNYDTVRIIEIIPKEFIDSAKKILSDSNFRIIQEDPIIEFTIPVQKGAKATISYGIGEITSEQANQMIQGNLIAKFSSPPLIIDKNTTTEQVIGNALFPTQLLIIAIIIIIILIVIVIIFFVKFSHPGHGFGGEKTIVEHITPEAEPEKPKWTAP